ncbi:MAG: glutaredoxin family protein [Leptolyngbyaceae cyanobacterium bins.302]|nr:glutaredoxin family protein [Leptolyngbyaceae cyanobacterium bins.302]
MRLILYSKPGCHLCEGLQEKLEQIQTIEFVLDIRDITTREDWFQQYQYEIPVLMLDKGQKPEESELSVIRHSSSVAEVQMTTDQGHSSPASLLPHAPIPLPRPSPRASVDQLEQMLQKYLNDPAQ